MQVLQQINHKILTVKKLYKMTLTLASCTNVLDFTVHQN